MSWGVEFHVVCYVSAETWFVWCRYVLQDIWKLVTSLFLVEVAQKNYALCLKGGFGMSWGQLSCSLTSGYV